MDTRNLAIELDILDLLPAASLDSSDVALTNLATKYAVENFYAPKYIADKVYAHSPLVSHDHKSPLT